MSTDRELLELAAKAAGIKAKWFRVTKWKDTGTSKISTGNAEVFGTHHSKPWNPLTDDGDRYRLCRSLGISIDFQDCCAWKRLSDHSLIQEYWGGECGDEAHAIVRAAAEIGRAMP